MHRLSVPNHPTYRTWSRTILYLAAALSLLAALIHLWVTPEHLEEWWGYGTFFLIAAIVQGFYGAALLRRPNHPLLLLGIGGNLSIVVLYLATRTAGIPFFGPHAGEVEGVRAIDLCATISELGIVVALWAVLLQGLPRERARPMLLITAVAIVSLGHLIHLLLRGSPAH